MIVGFFALIGILALCLTSFVFGAGWAGMTYEKHFVAKGWSDGKGKSEVKNIPSKREYERLLANQKDTTPHMDVMI